MSDLDSRIRDKLTAKPGSGNFMWHSDAADALRGVLDDLNYYDDCDLGAPSPDHVRAVIARELGIET